MRFGFYRPLYESVPDYGDVALQYSKVEFLLGIHCTVHHNVINYAKLMQVFKFFNRDFEDRGLDEHNPISSVTPFGQQHQIKTKSKLGPWLPQSGPSSSRQLQN
jgi:hypothetical protein